MKRGYISLVIVFVVVALSISGCRKKEGVIGSKCGGLHGFQCVANSFCRLDEGCGGIDHNGECEVRPASCPPEDSEICGCDGVTYGSECYAAVKGISVRHPGKCEGSESTPN